MKVAVFGATGTIGTALLPALARSHDVVALSRHEREGGGVNWLRADAGDAESVRRALEGVDVAYYLVHSLGTRDFEERDLAAARTVAEEAGRAGLSQLIYLGGLGDDSPELSPHLRSRLETEKELASGAVPLTTLRAAIVIGYGSAGFETIVALVDRLPAMVCPRWVGVRTQPIAIVDVIEYLAGVCGLPQAIGASFDIGGPDVIPDIHGNERKRVIFRKNDFETILQLVLLKRNRRQLVRWRRSGLAGGSCSQKQGRAQQTRDRPARRASRRHRRP
jgi:uncharacterized protein YbjT (DUF2867 family)